MAAFSRFAGAGTGALGGAGTGASIGSLFGPVGTGIGAALGALGGGAAGYFSGGDDKQSQELRDYFFGTPEGMQLYNQFTPEQQSQLSKLLGIGMDQYQNQYAGFEPIRQRAMDTFHQNIVPDIAERFSASGRNALSSGVLHSQLSSGASDLASRLAEMQSTYGMQNRDQALRALGLGFTPQLYSTGNQQAATQGILNSLSSGKQLGEALSGFIKAPKGQGLTQFHKAFAV